MYKVIKSEQLKNQSQYRWFKTFANPCYGLNVKMDVSEVVKYSKESKTSFFINVLYFLLNSSSSLVSLILFNSYKISCVLPTAKDGITTIDANTDLTSLFIRLLSVESWPTIGTNVSPLSISNPGPSIIGYTSAAGTGVASSNVEAGTKVWLTIQGQDASASSSRTYSGFTNGYSIVPSTSSSFTVYSGNPSTVSITGSENSGENYSITVSGYANTFFGDIPALSSTFFKSSSMSLII